MRPWWHTTSAVQQWSKRIGAFARVVVAAHTDLPAWDPGRPDGAVGMTFIPGEEMPEAFPSGLSHPVLVGYHGSRSSCRALAYAAGMAQRLGRPLLIVYVSPIYSCPLAGQVVMLVEEPDTVARWLCRDLDRICDTGRIAIAITTRRGYPAVELASAAAHHGADALVIGAPSRRWRPLTWSVSSSLARHPRCPVIVVP
jgi:nucleotide-binding universal stress UspA family protein